MIEETLLKSNYIGKDGFIWWLGQVAAAKYWDTDEKVSIDYQNNPQAWAYRCKVRIIGYHTFNRKELEDKDLPWAHIMLGATDGNAQAGLGKSHKLVGGETVFGFFLDGEDAQQPVVIGTLYRNANVKSEDIDFELDEIAFKPFSGAKTGRVKSGNTKLAQVTTKQNPLTPQPVGSGVTTPLNPVGVAATTSNSIDKFFPCDKALQKAYAGPSKVKITKENGCNDNFIGKITQAIQDFIATVNGLVSYLDVYVDPVLNVAVDIANEVKRTARTIVGTIKFLINNMRNVISKLVGCIFKKTVGLVVPIPQQPIVGEAAKNILNIIFCLFEKIIDRLLDFLEGLLQGMVGRALNAPLCAIEEVTAAILNQLLDIIDDLLAPIFSGLSWLIGGLSQIKGILSQATSIATEIFNLIGCDNLKCKTPSEWTLKIGPSQKDADDWNRVVGKMNILRNFNNDMNKSLEFLSIFGGGGSPIFRDCANIVNNPQSQSDLNDISNGSQLQTCIPPEIIIFGDGVGASAVAVVGNDSSILSIEILTPGFGYSVSPRISVIDKSGYGFGATAEAVIQNGQVTQIYLTSSGYGYCRTNLNVLVIKPYYVVTADRYSFYEGETCTFTISSINASDGTELSYYLSGDINSQDLDSDMSGRVTIFQNRATVPIKIKQDNETEQLEELIFNLLDANDTLVARTTVLINDRISPIIAIPPDGPQSPPGTQIPTGAGGGGGIPGGTSEEIPGGTGDGIETFPIDLFPQPDIGPEITGIVTSIVVQSPGIGYTPGDEIIVGDNRYEPIVSIPDGFIVGVNVISNPNEFNSLPDLDIDSNTGQGALLYPVLRFTPKVTSLPVFSINDKGVIKVVDCV